MATINLENVQPAIVVIIEKCDSTSRGFYNPALRLLVAKNTNGIKTSPSSDVYETDMKRGSRSYGGTEANSLGGGRATKRKWAR